jgi:hypothetical protein
MLCHLGSALRSSPCVLQDLQAIGDMVKLSMLVSLQANLDLNDKPNDWMQCLHIPVLLHPRYFSDSSLQTAKDSK